MTPAMLAIQGSVATTANLAKAVEQNTQKSRIVSIILFILASLEGMGCMGPNSENQLKEERMVCPAVATGTIMLVLKTKPGKL